MDTEVVARVAADILERSREDWYDIAGVAWVAMSVGGAQGEAEVMRMSLDAIRSLLAGNAVEIGNLAVLEDAPPVQVDPPDGLMTLAPLEFRSWDLDVDGAIERVSREWIGLGRSPNLGDIAWLRRVDVARPT